jgi:hypothetical protein
VTIIAPESAAFEARYVEFFEHDRPEDPSVPAHV